MRLCRWGCGRGVKPSTWHPTQRRWLSNAQCERCAQLRSRYGMAWAEFLSWAESQRYACAICHEDFDDQTPVVDHDHGCCPGRKTCGACVRGLVCQNCNRMLGHAHDDPARLRAAAAYLEAR